MMKWTDFLDGEVYERLCNCCSLKSDILPLAQAKWTTLKNKSGFEKEDALVAVLEQLDCNSCFFDLSSDEYDIILSSII